MIYKGCPHAYEHASFVCNILLYEGMQQVIKRTGRMAKVASVLLLTDGQANVGPSSKAAILDAMKNPTNYGDPGASYLRKAVDSVRHLFSSVSSTWI